MGLLEDLSSCDPDTDRRELTCEEDDFLKKLHQTLDLMITPIYSAFLCQELMFIMGERAEYEVDIERFERAVWHLDRNRYAICIDEDEWDAVLVLQTFDLLLYRSDLTAWPYGSRVSHPFRGQVA